MMSKATQLLGLMVLWFGVGWLGSSTATAQTSPAAAPSEHAPAIISVPRLMKFSGIIKDSVGNPRSGPTGITFALYKDQSGGAALWLETQSVTLDAQGRYTLLLGANSGEGITPELFSANQAQWLGVQPEGQAEQRVLLVSVPYALKAADAETLGGRPASSFVLAAPPIASDSAGTGQTGTSANAVGTSGPTPAAAITGGGSPNTVAEFDASETNLVSSSISDNGKVVSTTEPVGIGTTSPQALLDVQLTTGSTNNAVNSTITLNNSTAISCCVLSAFKMTLNDVSTATNLSKQPARFVYFRDPAATGGVSAFDAIMTATSFLSANAPYPLRGVNIEGPTIGSGLTLGNFTGLYIGSGGGGGTVTSKYALVTEANAGNVGIGITTPTQPLSVAGKIQSMSGGFMFPDATVQTTAATGTITGVTAGSGLAGGGTSGSVTLSANLNSVQARVTGTCSAGTALGSIGADGSVLCNAAGGGGSLTLPFSGTGADSPPGVQGVFKVTDTTNGPANSTNSGPPDPTTVPSALVGLTTGTGITAAVIGEATNSDGVGVVAINTAAVGDEVPVLVAWSQATSGNVSLIDAIASSSGTRGIDMQFAVTPSRGIIQAAVGPNNSATTVFSVDGSGSITTNANITANGGINAVGTIHSNTSVTAPTKNFKIDDPLAPADKWLYHTSVESPDMLNFYNGVVVLDARGQAWVHMPDWFQALNRDFRYQLTAVGKPAPSLYVAREIKDNRFKISGGRPHGKISWQVTGIRHDAYANAYRTPVEEEKSPAERGRYMHPELFGHPESEAIGAASPDTGAVISAAAGQR